MPKLRQTDLACPIWRYPFGSGGKRVATRPWNLSVLRCSSIISLIKSDGGGWVGCTMEWVPFDPSTSPLNISYPARLARPTGARREVGKVLWETCGAYPREEIVMRDLLWTLKEGIIWDWSIDPLVIYLRSIPKSAIRIPYSKIGGSSSGRTMDSGSINRGSNPCPPANNLKGYEGTGTLRILECLSP